MPNVKNVFWRKRQRASAMSARASACTTRPRGMGRLRVATAGNRHRGRQQQLLPMGRSACAKGCGRRAMGRRARAGVARPKPPDLSTLFFFFFREAAAGLPELQRTGGQAAKRQIGTKACVSAASLPPGKREGHRQPRRRRGPRRRSPSRQSHAPTRSRSPLSCGCRGDRGAARLRSAG